MSKLETDIQFLKGVGAKRAELLRTELSIRSFRDLLWHFPFRYTDKSRVYQIREINRDMPYILLKGKITGFHYEGAANKKRLVAPFTDGTGAINLVWFRGHQWIRKSIYPNVEYFVFGKPTPFKRQINIVHPEIEQPGAEKSELETGFEAVYPVTEVLKKHYVNSKAIRKLQKNLFAGLSETDMTETLPGYVVDKLQLMSFYEAMRNMHFPENAEKLKQARFRFKFEELFYVQLSILRLRVNRDNQIKGFIFSEVGETFNRFYRQNLSFTLTNAQKRVLKEIRKDLNSGKQMNRLLQGDVGSGKTLVALMSMLIAIDNGYQASVMAPTEILAQQHYETIRNFLKGMEVQVGLLTGSTPKSERKTLHEKLESGNLHILVGTHALIEDAVQFYNLGMVVIDEQHRFGVAQRARLWRKNEQPPHIMVMTATPIPRTLSMTLYGDLDVSVIDELPPGRKPVKTAHATDSQRLRVFKFMREEIAKGRQIYVVYPLIKESEKLSYKDLEDGYESVVRAFPPPDYQVSILHGQMKPAEKERSMQLFASGQAQILVSTTVIEVGVDVPNASVMLIESAERFGLSQLHQLRGRVGRGADQSYCILMTPNKLSDEAKRRVQIMVETTDGFRLAEEDMKIRGPGDIEGTQQSGVPFDFKVANLAEDQQTLEIARNAANRILDADPHLEREEHAVLTQQLKRLRGSAISWSNVS